MKTKETKKTPKKEPVKEMVKPAQAEKPVEKLLGKIIEKLAEKINDEVEKLDMKKSEKTAEIPGDQENKTVEKKTDLKKKVRTEKEMRAEKSPETKSSYQNNDEKSYQLGYSRASAITYVKMQVIEPAATPAPAYTQPVQPKDAYIPQSAGIKQQTLSHLETKLQAIETASRQPLVSYTRNDAKEKVYSSEKPQSWQQSTPSVIDSLLSLNTTSEFSIPEVRITTPQADLTGMQDFVQTAQTVYTAHKSGQKISGADLRMINNIKSEIGYKGSCCDELVVQKYAERKADVRKAA